MKSILYAGSALMIAAGIYGFAQFKNTKHNGAFQNMYEESEIAKPSDAGADMILRHEDPLGGDKAATAANTTAVQEVKQSPLVNTPQTVESNEISAEMFSRAPLKTAPEAGKARKMKREKQ